MIEAVSATTVGWVLYHVGIRLIEWHGFRNARKSDFARNVAVIDILAMAFVDVAIDCDLPRNIHANQERVFATVFRCNSLFKHCCQMVREGTPLDLLTLAGTHPESIDIVHRRIHEKPI